MSHLSVELGCLLGAILLGLVHVSLASFALKAQAGNRYTVGPRDAEIAPTGRAGRLARAQRNFMETFAFFAAGVLAVEVTQTHGALSAWGAVIYLGARAVYLPLYAAGIPWLRTFAWNIATAALAAVAVQPLV